MKLLWHERGWEDYLYWQGHDRALLKRLNLLIADIMRNGNTGIGKPEPLRHDFQGFWSRRINDEHRLVCRSEDDIVSIASCRYHYGKS